MSNEQEQTLNEVLRQLELLRKAVWELGQKLDNAR